MSTPMLTRYEQAHRILKGKRNNDIVRNDTVYSHWSSDADGSGSEYFWYQKQTATGKEFRWVDVSAATNEPAFDHALLANLLTQAIVNFEDPVENHQEITGLQEKNDQVINPLDLPLTAVTISASNKEQVLQVSFTAMDKRWLYEPDNALLKEAPPAQLEGFTSPDGKKIAFSREHNICIRDVSSGEEKQLTQDGAETCVNGETAIGKEDALLWSGDSQSLLFAQLDRREAKIRHYINYAPLDGSLEAELVELAWPYAGDESIGGWRLFIVDVSTGETQKADYPLIPEIACGAHLDGFLTAGLAWWSADKQRVFFVDSPRDVRTVRVVEWDTLSGSIRVLFEETDDIAVRLRHDITSPPIIAPLPKTNELIWFSERSGWGHLYLYDLNSGELKHQITGASGNNDWLVNSILHVDAERRELLIQTAGRDPSINPYYRDLCKVNIDTGLLTPILSGNYEHRVYKTIDVQSLDYVRTHYNLLGDVNIRRVYSGGVSSTGQYLIATRSRADTAPESLLIDRNGREILTVEAADTSDLPTDWQWPEPVKLKAADGETDIYAVVFRPPGFSPEQSYPIVDFLSSTRGGCTLPLGSFVNTKFYGTNYYQAAAMAALGFVVVCIAGRGTTGRDKAFYTHHYGDYAYSNDFNDRIAGIRQLAERYPYMDINRVGINGDENPINNVIYASLLHSNFYKVTVLHCMGDPRFALPIVTETTEMAMSNMGLPRTPYPEDCVESFSGKLLLIQGLKVSSIEPSYRLVDALVNANKDVDMLCVPNMLHMVTPYTLRRQWDYLVTHLMGEKPPEQFLLTVY
ncbi:Prolyl tripeptidyl peptidase precursor [Gammaproteobacteria bacterium MOLA455]|nr:Prolyl tripeptidyl peptidase precursor [Gammaproteobacteria bacterium MOLA455]